MIPYVITAFPIFSLKSNFDIENLSYSGGILRKIKQISAKKLLFLTIETVNKEIKSKIKSCRK